MNDARTHGFEEETLPAQAEEVQEPSEELPGGTIGRYVVLDRLGAGAMGVVFAAYDPELDRKVALKLLKAHGGGSSGARARLQREAQALAKLDHPNVVSIHDVGIHGDQLFMAMEFVEGETLRSWMDSEEHPRPWRQILRVFIAAGRGLAAAHEAGMVHRDFKPDNVMLGANKRVRVMDFGLARSENSDSCPTVLEAADLTAPIFSDRLTKTGALMGTPAYMSPEQIGGSPADARSDQFGFCIALYEALYGVRPFAGTTVGEVLCGIVEAEIQAAPRISSVPLWVRKIIVRGLDPEPKARFATMPELLSALAADPAVRRRRWLAGGIGLVAVASLGWGASQVLQRDAELCGPRTEMLADVWTPDHRVRIREAIASHATVGPQGAARVEAALDEYAQRWLAAGVEACEATRDGTQSGELLDLRIACLDDRLTAMSALVQVLAEANAVVASGAILAVQRLPKLERCADADVLLAGFPPPEDPELAARVDALERRLADAHALRIAAESDRALAIVEEISSEAQSLDYPPLRVHVLEARGQLQASDRQFNAAEATLNAAYDLALRSRMLEEAARIAAALADIVGGKLARHDEGHRWLVDAEPLAIASGSDDTLCDVYRVRGMIAGNRGEYERSREQLTRALELRERIYGPEHNEIAIDLNNLGVITTLEGDLSRARHYYQRALEIRELRLGPDHPAVGYLLNNLGDLAREAGDYVQARRMLERAYEILRRVHGSEHPVLAETLQSLGVLEILEGDPEQGRVHLVHALTLMERAYGVDNPVVAKTLVKLATALLELGAIDQAKAHLERALGVQSDHPVEAFELAETRFVLARALAAHAERDGNEFPTRAKSLATLARSAYVEIGLRGIEPLARVEAWLAERDDSSTAQLEDTGEERSLDANEETVSPSESTGHD